MHESRICDIITEKTTTDGLSMEKLLLIDGSNLLFQMFFGMPARIINKSGRAIHGTMGFVGALLKIIRMTCPTHIAVLFDGEHENPRAALNSDYKANRIDYAAVPEEASPFSQLPDIYAALDYLKIKRAETTDCETDDWIAGYVHTYKHDTQIVISSFDSDYFQLLSDTVSVLRYRGRKSTLWTSNELSAHFDILPEQYADFKALTGDVSDNIKGADKIGPKTAALLLKQFGALESLLLNAEQIEKQSVRASVIQNRERLKTNYRLIKLAGSEKLPFTLDELSFSGLALSTTEILKEIKLLP